jgi:hypothetical protein
MMSFAYPKNRDMRNGILLGSAALLFIIALSQVASFMMKDAERPVPFESKDEGAVAVELVFRGEDRGIYYFPGHHRVDEFVSRVSSERRLINRTVLSDGMSIQIKKDDIAVIEEMAPHKKLALGIPLDINRLSAAEIMLIPGIGEKTAEAIHTFIEDRGCIRDLSELSEISGIKDRKIANMRKYFITEPDSCERSKQQT